MIDDHGLIAPWVYWAIGLGLTAIFATIGAVREASDKPKKLKPPVDSGK